MAKTTTRQKRGRPGGLPAERRQAWIRYGLAGLAAVLLLAGIYYVADQTIRGEQDKVRPPAHPAEQSIPNEGASHVEEGTPLTYAHYPPSSGQHYGRSLPEGYYDEPFSEGFWVHSLEHGVVVVLYNCPGGCPDLQARLKALFSKAPRRRCDLVRLIVLPYSQGMATPISVIAWGRQLDLAAYDEDAILNFYKRYEDRGPEVLPCT